MQRAALYDDAFRRFLFQPVPELRERLEREAKRAYLWVQECKDKFLPEQSWQELRVLESGGGMGGLALLLMRQGATTALVDFAPTAVELARTLGVDAHCFDVTQPDVTLGKTFHLIADSHLLHCLPLAHERSSYFSFLKEHLAPGGIIVGETMVHRKKLFIPEGWRLDAENVLWQRFDQWVPVRKIADSLDLEAEFTRAGFSISYFYYYANYGIAPSAEFWDVPADVLPASVRFVLKRA
jgi:2-polyprenyl-3-methyl-5-hydroxy-6-metoxy-1,4-benzoquinol methylase